MWGDSINPTDNLPRRVPLASLHPLLSPSHSPYMAMAELSMVLIARHLGGLVSKRESDGVAGQENQAVSQRAMDLGNEGYLSFHHIKIKFKKNSSQTKYSSCSLIGLSCIVSPVCDIAKG